MVASLSKIKQNSSRTLRDARPGRARLDFPKAQRYLRFPAVKTSIFLCSSPCFFSAVAVLAFSALSWLR